MNQNMNKLFLKYHIALDKLRNYFNSLDLEYATLSDNNPIEHLRYRLKKTDSIVQKLQKKNSDLTPENIEDKLKDVVGVRVVCSFLDDMYEVINRIHQEFEVIDEKDYVTTPKENGYSSYHIIIKLPVFIQNQKEYVTAEIQIRTIAMDMWASLEHKIWYKKGIKLPDDLMTKILDTAQVCRYIDENLNKLIREKNVTNINEQEYQLLINDKKFNEEMFKYRSALEIVQKKLNLMYEEYEINGQNNPLEHVKGRLKTPARIGAKLTKLNKSLNLRNMQEYVNDIAGLRIVCSFRSDVWEIVDRIKNDPDLINDYEKEQDYITTPKESGYSSYHLLVYVPVALQTGTTYVKVEIQIRTIAMDMWASLEHKLCYQKEVSPEIKTELHRLAGIIEVIDRQMEETIQTSRNLLQKKKRNNN